MLPSPPLPSARRLAEAMRRGEPVADEDFDQFLPEELRRISRTYWTPLAVAAQIAGWLDELKIGTLVDIGSGAGKLCVAAALGSRTCRIRGVEHRAPLVEVARQLAARFEIESRCSFLAGPLTAVPEAGAYYLYNPFGENHYRPEIRIDDGVEMGAHRFVDDVAAAEQLLAQARRGTYVIIYNGFGGELPGTYQRLRRELDYPSVLELWRKTMDDDELFTAVGP